MDAHQLSMFSLWFSMDLDVCRIEWYQGISAENLPNGSHVLPPGHHIRHPYHHILTVALEQQACLFKLHPARAHVCSTCTRQSAQSSLPQGQQTNLTLRICLNQLQMTCKHICRCRDWISRYICNTCLRPAVMSLCSYPTTTFLVISSVQ